MRIIKGTNVDGLTSGAISVSTENDSFLRTNVQDDILTNTWRTLSASSQSIVFDMGSAITADTVAIINHNLTTASGEVFIQANSADSWAAPGLSAAVTVRADLMLTFFTSTSARYWRLTLNDTSLSDDYIEVGKIKIEAYNAISPSCNYEFSEGRDTNDSLSYTQTGQIYSDQGLQFTTYNLSFPYTSNTQKASVESIFTSVGNFKPFVLSIHDDVFTYHEPLFCNITNSMTYNRQNCNGWIYSLNVRECK